MANTSQHLQKLLKDGIVACDKRVVARVYRLSNTEVLNAWSSLQRLAREINLQVQQDELLVCPPDLLSDLKPAQVVFMRLNLKKNKATS